MQKYFIRSNWLKSLLMLILPVSFYGCAILHHVQVGQIDNRSSETLIPFEIMMSEVGVSTEEIGKMAKATKSSGGDQVADLAAIVSLFQFGPKTGNITYNERYAERMVYEIHQKCPSGKVTGLMSVREMRKYPAISGEIVKVSGYCRKARVQPTEVGTLDKEKRNEGEI